MEDGILRASRPPKVGGIDQEGIDVNPNYMTDAERSALRPFGPHLIEKSADSPAQAVTRSGVTIIRPYTATVAITAPATRVRRGPYTSR